MYSYERYLLLGYAPVVGSIRLNTRTMFKLVEGIKFSRFVRCEVLHSPPFCVKEYDPS